MSAVRVLPVLLLTTACAGRTPVSAMQQQEHELPPGVIPHAQWESQRPLGYAADANRRNLRAGDTLRFHDLGVSVVATSVDSSTATPTDVVRLRLERGGDSEEREVREGAALNWHGYHLPIRG